MKQRYEKQIDQIKRENKEAIDGLLNEFKTNLRKVHYEYKESEEFASKLKQYYAKKLEKQEQTHEEEVMDLNLQHHDEDERKRQEVHEKQEKLQRKIIKKDNAAKEKKAIQTEYQIAEVELARVRAEIEKLQ